MKYAILIGLLLILPLASAIPAFPGAEGYGAEALSNCDRTKVNVIEVTTLQDGIPGSFRDAFKKYQDGILNVIVFRVGGLLELDPNINNGRGIENIDKHNCIYVAGQTAPGDGITIRHQGRMVFWFRNGQPHDLVFRYLRFRSGASDPRINSYMVRVNAGNDIIFDHNSFSWSPGKLISIAQLDTVAYSKEVHDISLQRNMFYEVLYTTNVQISGTPKEDSPTRRISVDKNIIAHGHHRNPNINSKQVKVINNVIYNWKQGATQTNGWSTVDVIGNFYKTGPMENSRYNYEVTVDPDNYANNANTRLFVEKNVGPHNSDSNANNYEGSSRMTACYYTNCGSGGEPIPFSYKKTSPFPSPTYPIDIMDPYDAYDSVMQDSGANKKLDCQGNFVWNQDSSDARIVNEVKTGTGTNTDLSHEDQVGGQPLVRGDTACPDSDHDGMFDAWETKYGLNPNNAADNAGDLDGDGYSNIEEFLNGDDPTGGIVQPPVDPPPVDPPVEPPQTPGFDLNSDGTVNIFDLIMVAKGIGSGNLAADANGDGVVNIFDLIMVIKNFI